MSSDAINPALLDRARKAWPKCAHGVDYFQSRCDGETPCDLHAAIARALEEERSIEHICAKCGIRIEQYDGPEEDDITW